MTTRSAPGAMTPMRRATLLLMNDDGTVTRLTRCDDCGFLFRDIERHVRESVTVPAFEAGSDDDGS